LSISLLRGQIAAYQAQERQFQAIEEQPFRPMSLPCSGEADAGRRAVGAVCNMSLDEPHTLDLFPTLPRP
jgi:hypothetical protein